MSFRKKKVQPNLKAVTRRSTTRSPAKDAKESTHAEIVPEQKETSSNTSSIHNELNNKIPNEQRSADKDSITIGSTQIRLSEDGTNYFPKLVPHDSRTVLSPGPDIMEKSTGIFISETETYGKTSKISSDTDTNSELKLEKRVHFEGALPEKHDVSNDSARNYAELSTNLADSTEPEPQSPACLSEGDANDGTPMTDGTRSLIRKKEKSFTPNVHAKRRNRLSSFSAYSDDEDRVSSNKETKKKDKEVKRKKVCKRKG